MEVAPCVAGSAPRASARATTGERACDEVGKGVRWRRGEDGVSKAAQVGGPGVAGWLGRFPAPGCSARAVRGRKEEEEEEGRKGRREKKKREKEKGKKKRERGGKERERAVGAIRGGGRPRTRCGVRPVSDEHAEREKGKGDRTTIGTGVVMADHWEKTGSRIEKDLG